MLKLEKLSQKVSIYSAVSRAAFQSRDCLSMTCTARTVNDVVFLCVDFPKILPDKLGTINDRGNKNQN